MQLRQTAQTVDEIMAVLSERDPAAPKESLRPFAQSLAWVDPNYLTAITWGNERETARDVDFEAHIRGIACPVLLMQADLAIKRGAGAARPGIFHGACAAMPAWSPSPARVTVSILTSRSSFSRRLTNLPPVCHNARR